MKISKNFSHPLMENNITKPDLDKVINFLKKKIFYLLKAPMFLISRKNGLNG